VALAALALAGVFQGELLFGGHLHGFDWQVHWHYYDWIRIGLQEHGTLPRFMIDAWHTPNFVGNAQSPVLGPGVWSLAFLPTELYLKLLITVYTALGVAGSWLLARDLGAPAGVAACAAALFCCGGFFAAHVAVGHHWSLGVYWLPWVLLLLRRASAGSRAAWVGLACVQASTLLEGQHHPFLWQNGLVALWAIFEGARSRDPAALRVWLGATALGVALAAVRVVPVLLEFADYAPTARIDALPASALLSSLLSPAQGPETSVAGLVFDHGSGWWEYDFYLGVAGVLFVAVGLLGARRREVPLLAAGLVAFLLSLDTTSLGLDPWRLLGELPVITSQRAPSRLMILAVFAAIFAAAAGWTRVLTAAQTLHPGWHVTVASWLLALVIAIPLVDAARPWQAAALGPRQESRAHAVRPPRLLPPADGTVETLPAGPNALHYRVTSERPGTLALRLDWASSGDSWEAGGRETVRTPDGRVGVPVDAGVTEVILRHRTPGWAVGIGISLGSALGLAGWLLFRQRRASRSGQR
jgi:hypothetical protein